MIVAFERPDGQEFEAEAGLKGNNVFDKNSFEHLNVAVSENPVSQALSGSGITPGLPDIRLQNQTVAATIRRMDHHTVARVRGFEHCW